MKQILAAVFAGTLPIVTLIAPMGPAVAVPASTGFRFLEKPGSYGVGLKVVEQYDDSRTFQASADNSGKSNVSIQARPLQTLVWYPATRGEAKPVWERGGMELGTIGAFLVLEEKAHAQARGATPLILVPSFPPEHPAERELRHRILDDPGLPYVLVPLDPRWRIAGDGHPDAEANRAMAEAVLTALRRGGRLNHPARGGHPPGP